MSHVSRDEAKSWSKIYFADKDAEVDLVLGAAEGFVANFLGRESLADEDLNVEGDSPGAPLLKPDVKLVVLMAFDESWQNRGINVVGSITTENPQWMRVAHLYRKNLGV